MTWTAQWIWHKGETEPRNQFVAFRKTFTLKQYTPEAQLHISADTRYRVWVNGQVLGEGPPRSWPWEQTYDTYEVSALLAKGRNTIAVLVNHYGEGTLQYIPGRGGLLCELAAGTTVVGTDNSWKTRVEPGFLRPTPRACCQQGFEEHHDARQTDPDWMLSDYADGRWGAAHVIGPVGVAPWTKLIPRDIPHLTRNAVYPVSLPRTRVVRASGDVLALDFRDTLFEGDPAALPDRFNCGVYVTELVSPAAQTIDLLPHNTAPYAGLYVNGRPVSGTRFKVRKGRNLLAVHFQGVQHWTVFSLVLAPARRLRYRRPDDPSAKGTWLYVGSFAADEANEALRVCRCKTGDQLAPFAGRTRPVRLKDHLEHDAYNVIRSQQPVDGAAVRLTQPTALLSDNAAWATVHPVRQGDTELLLDFGRELRGYWEFELDAPAGTVLDVLCFEAIEDQGIHYPDQHVNSLRYICREGVQRYTSFAAHGFRYMIITLRDATRLVRLRQVRCLQSVYPADKRGYFRSSDARLNRIWDVGEYTLQLCAEDTFTDCPCYEQVYWVGDARNEALISYAAWGPTPLARRCVALVPPSLKRSEFPESQVPSSWQGIIPAWFMLWIFMVDEHYQYTADTKTLRQVYPGVRKTLKNCYKRCTHDGLFSLPAWNLFDWAPQDSVTPTVTHNSMFLVGALQRAERLAGVLGRRDDARWFARFARELTDAINQATWNEEQQAYVDAVREDEGQSQVVSQHCQTLALLYDIAPPARAAAIADVPARPRRGMVEVGSPFALFYILEALVKQGRHEDVLAIIRDRWGLMLDKGATTFWEIFPGNDIGGGYWTRSHCHAWSAAPTYFLTTYQLGVAPASPGYATLRIAPQPAGLAWAEGVVPTPPGDVFVRWEQNRKTFTLTAELPADVRAELVLPVDAREYNTVHLNGKPYRQSATVPRTGRLTRADNRWTLQTRPGCTRVELTAARG